MGAVVAVLGMMLAIYVAAEFVVEYSRGLGSPWQRALDAAKGSATILWARFTMFLGALSAVAVDASGYLGVPQVADTIKAILAPEYVGPFLVLVAVVSEFARRRTLL